MSATTNTETVAWGFWTEPSRHTAFRTALTENGVFLLRWLLLAYLIEAIMLRHIPAEWISAHLGHGGPLPIVSAAILDGPAYLNGYAAVPLVDALLQ